ncbi:MAG: hypothetical protein E1N59_509 [Puniceicoccaceae bacterium 5H]|nr:MAG: hypothetical protein E1N59_509 [Puniceicoccaceae bacterium 5H]
MDRQEIERLLVWQDRDVRVDGLKKQLAKLPREVELAETEIREERARLEAAEQALKALEIKRQSTEGQIASHEDAIVRYKTQQLQVKKNEAYAALQHEIDVEQGKISDLEDTVLELLDEVETQRETVVGLRDEVERSVARLEKQIAGLQEQEEVAKGEVEAAEQAAVEAANAVEEGTRKAYTFVKTQVKRPPYAVPLSDDKKCPACHLRVSGEIEAQVRRSEGHPRCNNCGRMLYWEA